MEIWQEVLKLQRDRMDKQREVMAEYDSTVYLPRLRELRQKCTHPLTTPHPNLLGECVEYCRWCGKRVSDGASIIVEDV